ncbi:uncharacterized protein CMC5_073170 [Chondromyces crocatus]|uniref:RCC1-like domain-containing protein n=2 Tax=Chondromyces crocatus TaxID=52 RepID=A0A0K1EQK7_CHOCO|nr:uncharacterized protein CMC5_073170 [Chondromyces crocatus]
MASGAPPGQRLADQLTPPPPENHLVDLIAAGGHHTCARLVEGSVWCWGRNDHGQLGWGAPTLNMPTRTLPTLVRGLTGVEELSLGQQHACARSKDGTVRCWGSNENGQLGDGTAEDRYEPVQVKGVVDAIALGAGSTATCAVLTGGSVICWGGLPGQNAVPPAAPVAQSRTAMPVSGLSDIVAVTVGRAHACALGSDGKVSCWGDNAAGQLGDGSVESQAKPVAVKKLAGVARVDAGTTSTCALLRDARVRCWGRLAEQEFGPVPKPLPGGSSVAEIAGSCARGTEGAVSCRRGDGIEVVEEGGAARIAAGEGHACLLTGEGEVRCWGSNASGQLGDGSKLVRTLPTALRW